MSFARKLPDGLPTASYDLRAARLWMCLTQAELAKAARVPVRWIWAFEHGKDAAHGTNPTDCEHGRRLRDALKVLATVPRTDLQSIARRIAAVNHWSTRECSDRSGLSRTTWQRVVKGDVRPTPSTRAKLQAFVERYG